jgi:hypothetical protein
MLELERRRLDNQVWRVQNLIALDGVTEILALLMQPFFPTLIFIVQNFQQNRGFSCLQNGEGAAASACSAVLKSWEIIFNDAVICVHIDIEKVRDINKVESWLQLIKVLTRILQPCCIISLIFWNLNRLKLFEFIIIAVCSMGFKTTNKSNFEPYLDHHFSVVQFRCECQHGNLLD